MARPLPLKRKRRSRTSSLEVEIRERARQIQADQMSEAMKAATLMIVARKQDEILALLRSLGATNTGINVATNGRSIQGMGTQPASIQQPIEHPCVQCGRESVKRSKPNQWNRTGSWYCPAHVALGNTSDFEDAIDNKLLGPQAIISQKPTVLITNTPAIMRQEQALPAEIQPTATGPQDIPGAGSLADAMSALGVSNGN